MLQTITLRKMREWQRSMSGETSLIFLALVINIRTHYIGDTEGVVGGWLDFLDLDHRRLGCIQADMRGQFYREKNKRYKDPYSDEDKTIIHNLIAKISNLLEEHNFKDCTKLFKYRSVY